MQTVLRLCCVLLLISKLSAQDSLKINEKEYFELPGFNVMAFQDFYAEGHQTGVTIIQCGQRTIANGDIRLEPSPGQWSPIPKLNKRNVNLANNEITAELSYPDPSRDRKGFNPIIYPDLKLNYKIRVKGIGKTIKIFVDLENPIPEEWAGKAGFNLELFPGLLFGKSYILDGATGIFPEQANGPFNKDFEGNTTIIPMAEGRRLIIAPEVPEQKITIESKSTPLILLDGRGSHYNGWFIIRSVIPAGKTSNALEWTITPEIIPGWKYKPVVQISQIGYHPAQPKVAVVEEDLNFDKDFIILIKITENGPKEIIKEKPERWGNFLRYNYLKFDFTRVTEPGIYRIKYGGYITNPFRISEDIYDKNVWQPTLEYFLPVQMCHMRVNDGYRVWHGLCHNDDALMAEVDTNHFDGYLQGSSTLTNYKPLEHVPGLNSGGWHDAGDDDLRIESQSGELFILSLAYEEFNVTDDETTIDQNKKLVEIHVPDGKPDILQQIEHGALIIVNGYNSLGRLYRGIITPTLKQYVQIGDFTNVTDNRIYNSSLGVNEIDGQHSGSKDDRWVFTEINPFREFQVAAGLAAAYRSLKNYNPSLSDQCLRIAEEVWNNNKPASDNIKMNAAIELFISTGKDEYKNIILADTALIKDQAARYSWLAARCLPFLKNSSFKKTLTEALKIFKVKLTEQQKESPYDVPYKPDIWGAGWTIQNFGVSQYFLNKYFPAIFSPSLMFSAINFVLGCHPGENTSSFVSGVGAKSLTVAYGFNRADWSYIPGGVGSGTALIRPDLPELKIYPYFWQQTEYVMGGGATNFMFLILAANKIIKGL